MKTKKKNFLTKSKISNQKKSLDQKKLLKKKFKSKIIGKENKQVKKTKKVKKTNNIKDKNKLCVIFDMDQTLIHFIYEEKGHKQLLRADKNTKYKIYAKKEEGKMVYGNIFIRKYALFLLKYCIENFNVGVWSTGNDWYVEAVLKKILPDELYNKLNVIIGRTYYDHKITKFKDIKNDKKFTLSNFNGLPNKNLDFLYENKFYSKFFNHKNTILIDDLAYNNVVIPLNNIYIPPYCYMKNDNCLFDIYLWFKKNKNTKNIQKTEKIIFYGYNKPTPYPCKLSNYKLIKTNNINVGDYVQLKLKNKDKDKDKDKDKEDKLIDGYIERKNKNTFDIVEYDEEKVEKVEKVEGDKGKMEIYKNIKLQDIKKWILN